ncbi:MAG TPA: SDR family NAD(P)-dependent oxidoreductase [Dongiaceae bacterium]|jgi:NAD(P)-dependent dehydrogenase (short-subunit alcohol dehydrogenase family)|nr:SDR family NAD(P)-dependent oxidoreductase [Dongiaceae bacterium]
MGAIANKVVKELHMDFGNQTVMITGAAGNLGAAVAAAFAAAGANLALLDLNDASLAKVQAAGAGDVLRQRVDLADPASISAATGATLSRFGRIDALCNLAGGFQMGERVHEVPADKWNFMMELNAGSVLRMSHAVVPHMLKAGGGKIVNIGAYSALSGKAEMAAYIASKSAVIRLTESMAAELRGHNINVNCVLPSIIDTPQNRAAMPKADPKKWVAPEALADVLLFLCSPAARAIHGAAIPVVGLS